MADARANIAAGRMYGLYGAPTPSDWPELDIDNPTELEIQAARQEVADLPRTQYPSAFSVASNHPGILGYQVMTDEEYQNAVRYDNLMRRLESIQRGVGAHQFAGAPSARELMGGSHRPEPIRDRSFTGRMLGREPHAGTEQLPPYRHRGILASGQPLRNMMEMWMVPFSTTANNVVRPLYDLDKAVQNMPEVNNKATLGLPRAAMALADPSYRGEMNPAWAEERRFAEAVPFDNPIMLETRGDPAKFYQQLPSKTPSGIVEGAEILADVGYPEHWSRDLTGMLLESTLDPASGFGAVARNVGKLGRYAAPAAQRVAMGRAAGGLASEAAPAGGMTALLEILRRTQEQR